MKASSIVLGILALVAAAIGYAVSYAILSALSLPDGLAQIVILFVPVFVAGLCMIPFVAPLLDRAAKRDLEAYRRQSAATDQPPVDPDAPGD